MFFSYDNLIVNCGYEYDMEYLPSVFMGKEIDNEFC